MEEIVKLSKTKSIKVDKPNICPHCQKGIDPKIIGLIGDEYYNQFFVFIAFKCPICQQIFFGKYFLGNEGAIEFFEMQNMPLQPVETIGGHGLIKEFPEEIRNLSPHFVEAYNDAYKAEQNGLSSIVGIGYRLAFEHLIKDFCISLKPEEKDKIAKAQLSQCVNDYLDSDIKELIKRATWLGNDFAHYESKHPDMHLDDFKKLIELCVSKIVAKIQEKHYLAAIGRK